MEFWMECVVGTLAALGLICILKTVYAIIISGCEAAAGCAALYLYGDGADADSLRLLHAAEQAQRTYLPRLRVTFVDTGDAAHAPAAAYAARRGMRYVTIKTDETNG